LLGSGEGSSKRIAEAYRRAYGDADGAGKRICRLGERGRVARAANRGEIWRYRFSAPDKQRPVLVLTRQEVIGLIHTVMVACARSAVRSRSPWGCEG
jgi:hypothetical protein